MSHELRCSNKLHALIVDGAFEVKCGSRFCGSSRGVVVLHRFDIKTGELTQTLKFREPNNKEGPNGD